MFNKLKKIKVMAFRTLSWGKPTLYISKLNASGEPTTWSALPTPVNESTTLEYSEGTEYRAEIEGGELEGYKRGKGNYTLNFTIREDPTTTIPITDDDGAINDQYAIKLVPETATAKGFYIKCATGYVAPNFSSTDGLSKEYHFTAITPTDGSGKIEWGVIEAPTTT